VDNEKLLLIERFLDDSLGLDEAKRLLKLVRTEDAFKREFAAALRMRGLLEAAREPDEAVERLADVVQTAVDAQDDEHSFNSRVMERIDSERIRKHARKSEGKKKIASVVASRRSTRRQKQRLSRKAWLIPLATAAGLVLAFYFYNLYLVKTTPQAFAELLRKGKNVATIKAVKDLKELVRSALIENIADEKPIRDIIRLEMLEHIAGHIREQEQCDDFKLLLENLAAAAPRSKADSGALPKVLADTGLRAVYDTMRRGEYEDALELLDGTKRPEEKILKAYCLRFLDRGDEACALLKSVDSDISILLQARSHQDAGNAYEAVTRFRELATRHDDIWLAVGYCYKYDYRDAGRALEAFGMLEKGTLRQHLLITTVTGALAQMDAKNRATIDFNDNKQIGPGKWEIEDTAKGIVVKQSVLSPTGTTIFFGEPRWKRGFVYGQYSVTVDEAKKEEPWFSVGFSYEPNSYIPIITKVSSSKPYANRWVNFLIEFNLDNSNMLVTKHLDWLEDAKGYRPTILRESIIRHNPKTYLKGAQVQALIMRQLFLTLYCYKCGVQWRNLTVLYPVPRDDGTVFSDGCSRKDDRWKLEKGTWKTERVKEAECYSLTPENEACSIRFTDPLALKFDSFAIEQFFQRPKAAQFGLGIDFWKDGKRVSSKNPLPLNEVPIAIRTRFKGDYNATPYFPSAKLPVWSGGQWLKWRAEVDRKQKSIVIKGDVRGEYWSYYRLSDEDFQTFSLKYLAKPGVPFYVTRIKISLPKQAAHDVGRIFLFDRCGKKRRQWTPVEGTLDIAKGKGIGGSDCYSISGDKAMLRYFTEESPVYGKIGIEQNYIMPRPARTSVGIALFKENMGRDAEVRVKTRAVPLKDVLVGTRKRFALNKYGATVRYPKKGMSPWVTWRAELDKNNKYLLVSTWYEGEKLASWQYFTIEGHVRTFALTYTIGKGEFLVDNIKVYELKR